LTGKRAFQGPSQIETMSAILTQEPPDVSIANPAVAAAFERTVKHCLEKRPEDRFQSTRDLVFDLEALASGTTIAGSNLADSGFSKLRKAGNLRRLWPVLAVPLILLAALGAFLFGRRNAVTPLATYTQLTFRRGTIWSARFAPDDASIVYSAAWNGNPSELFLARRDGVESRSLGITHADIFSISSTGE